jgi:Mannosyl-glycoprotein endo-beta-N-acetylglucosaminidase
MTVRPRRSLLIPLVALVLGALGATACVPPGPPGSVTVMGDATATSAQLAAWFNGRKPHPSGVYAASVPVQTLAQYFIEEGDAEGVRGDVAFVQSVLETGWFRFPGSVPASYNNFAGIGATGAGGVPAQFPDARTGVRAQIQHLRAYADATATSCTIPPLHHSCVDPRFGLVTPKGKAPTWNQMGNGNWATSTTYAQKIVSLYAEMLAY